MKKSLFILLFILLLSGCGTDYYKTDDLMESMEKDNCKLLKIEDKNVILTGMHKQFTFDCDGVLILKNIERSIKLTKE